MRLEGQRFNAHLCYLICLALSDIRAEIRANAPRAMKKTTPTTKDDRIDVRISAPQKEALAGLLEMKDSPFDKIGPLARIAFVRYVNECLAQGRIITETGDAPSGSQVIRRPRRKRGEQGEQNEA